MTCIAVFCDGTWNAADNVEPTHVVALSRTLVNDPRAGQVVADFAGSGTDRRFEDPFARFVNRWGGRGVWLGARYQGEASLSVLVPRLSAW
ncbi:DUF2235 domain-containing protein [Roseovarius sp. LXJ103]|uniref:DUF2235 domain-containing protein n=1 Tax=Roseovarius carneus TaxID=2853164 RepID=UPI0015E812BF|nr:DUF2235 domain-containing protein [Roseovarius carneus]MBZ8119786.1 DUF2235 domain-containing protein [Roseovarius carneus]